MNRVSFHEERTAAKELKEEYRLCKKLQVYGIVWVLLILAVVSFVIWLLDKKLDLGEVTWPQAFTAVLSLGIAIIAYRQWIAARHEISIDKYYDRLDTANKRLEVLYNDDAHKKSMHVFAQLDKLEYVIIKYELGYISPLLARRAVLNFKGHCEDKKSEFRELTSKWIEEAAYLPKTKEIVKRICERCKRDCDLTRVMFGHEGTQTPNNTKIISLFILVIYLIASYILEHNREK